MFLGWQDSKKQHIYNQLFLGLVFVVLYLVIFYLRSGVIGFLVLLSIYFHQSFLISSVYQQKKLFFKNHLAYFTLVAYYTISLTIIYYFFGLYRITIFLWYLLTYLFLLYLLNFKLDIFFSFNYKFINKIKEDLLNIINNSVFTVIMALMIYSLIYFFRNTISNGSPSPWINVSFVFFIIFFIISFLLIYSEIQGKRSIILNILYFAMTILVIAIKYTLSYGYDTLLHQASLKYIASFGNIHPLTPFYIGQYVWEVLIHFFTSWSFIFLERYFLSAMLIITTLVLGDYILKKLKFKFSSLLILITILLLIPTYFTYTSPYGFSLLWSIVAVSFFIYFLLRMTQWICFWLSFLC